LKTLTGNEQVAVLPDESVAVQVTVVVPTGKIDPLAGEQTTVATEQLSIAAGSAKATATPVDGGQVWAVTLVMPGGQAIAGACVSWTLTVNEQAGPTDGVQVTVVVPTGNNDPLAGEQVTLPHSPFVVGAGKLTTAPHLPELADTVMFIGQLIEQVCETQFFVAVQRVRHPPLPSETQAVIVSEPDDCALPVSV
jgi:hypothetical protein